MKVLFVSSGNSESGISPIVFSQGNSLKEHGISLDFFTIKGKGATGYLKNIRDLKQYLLNSDFDLVHAHYSFSGIVAALGSRIPVVVSLMGSDIKAGLFMKLAIIYMNRFRWQRTIIKSERMKRDIPLRNISVIPNGVDLRIFRPMEKKEARRKIGFNEKKRHIIFVADPRRKEKNFPLAQAAFDLLQDDSVALHVVSGVDHSLIVFYMNGADVLVLTSLWEGSPNVVKEAMACNLPIVSTDVGDVQEVIGNTAGCYIADFSPTDFAEKMRLALDFWKKTNGRNNISHLGEHVIADRLTAVYRELIP